MRPSGIALLLPKHACIQAPSLHGRYPLPRYYEPVRLPIRAASKVMFSLRALASSPSPPRRVSQVPRSICLHAPSPPTPASPATACAHCFIAGIRLHHSWADWPLAGLRNEAESGSLALRLADSPPEASPLGLLQAALGRLSLEWAIERMNSFQFIRSARLCLAHPRARRLSSGTSRKKCTPLKILT